MSTNNSTTLHIRRFIAAPRARVFAAFANPNEIKEWLGPKEAHCLDAKADVRAGGAYAFRMRSGETCEDGGISEITVRGEYLEVRSPERLVFTWAWEGDPDTGSRVTVDFLELDGGTDLQLTHEKLASAASRDRHTHGWSGSIEKLARLCAPESERADAKAAKPGMFGWNELMTTDTTAAQNFYTQLFGWKAVPFSEGPHYTLFTNGPEMAGGMMACVQPESPAYWLGYVIVAECDAAAARAVELGGKLCLPPKDIPTVGRIAIFADPQGATLGLFQPLPK